MDRGPAPRPSRDKFEIFVHPREDTLVGKIWHPFSRRARTFEGVDGLQIVRFIYECMPARPEPRGTANEAQGQPITRDGVVKQLVVGQEERRESGALVGLRREQPWSVTVRFALEPPPGDRIPFHVPDYTVRLVVRRSDTAGESEERTVVGTLVSGRREYESYFEMPALPAGEYVLDAYTRVPWASIAECDHTHLRVG